MGYIILGILIFASFILWALLALFIRHLTLFPAACVAAVGYFTGLFKFFPIAVASLFASAG